eukprot:450024-Lingulodinium_polyedra.AAC.1
MQCDTMRFCIQYYPNAMPLQCIVSSLVMHCNAIQCNSMQYHTIQCNTMQYNAMQYLCRASAGPLPGRCRAFAGPLPGLRAQARSQAGPQATTQA